MTSLDLSLAPQLGRGLYNKRGSSRAACLTVASLTTKPDHRTCSKGRGLDSWIWEQGLKQLRIKACPKLAGGRGLEDLKSTSGVRSTLKAQASPALLETPGSPL